MIGAKNDNSEIKLLWQYLVIPNFPIKYFESGIYQKFSFSYFTSEAYSELFKHLRLIFLQKQLTTLAVNYFVKISILNVWLGFEYAAAWKSEWKRIVKINT